MSGRRFITKDGEVVADGDPSAAFLAAPEGADLPDEINGIKVIVTPKTEATHTPKAVEPDPAPEPAPEPPKKKATAKKAAAKKGA